MPLDIEKTVSDVLKTVQKARAQLLERKERLPNAEDWKAVRVPGDIRIRSSISQVGSTGSPVPDPPKVQVLDRADAPLEGVMVGFAVSVGGGIVKRGRQRTDARGEATVGTWILGPNEGDYELVAVAEGLERDPQRFRATARSPRSIVPVTDQQQVGNVGKAVTHPPSVRVTDKNGRPCPNVKVTFKVSMGDGTVGRRDMPHHGPLGELLLAEALITPDQLSHALEVHQATQQRLGSVLQEMGVVDEEQISRLLSQQMDQWTNGNGYSTVGLWILGKAPGDNRLTVKAEGLEELEFTATGR